MHRLSCLFATSFVTLLTGFLPSALPAAEARVFPILIALTRDGLPQNQSISPGVRVSAARVESAVDRAFAGTTGVLQPWIRIGFDTPRGSFPAIALTLNNINEVINDRLGSANPGSVVKPEDTIFCYVLSHGACEPPLIHREDFEFGQFFQMENQGTYARCDLFELLLDQRGIVGTLERGSGLTILISDCCNVQVASGNVPFRIAAPAVQPSFTALRDLLTKHRGHVSLTAAATDEASWFSDSDGGLFTEVLLDSIAKYPANQAPTWAALMRDSVQPEAKRRFDLVKSQLSFPAGAKQSFTPTWMRQAAWVQPLK